MASNSHLNGGQFNTVRLTNEQLDTPPSIEEFSVPSTEQLLLYHGQELFTSVVTYLPVAHLVVAMDGRVLRANDVFQQLTHAGDQSPAGLPLTSLIAEASRPVTDRMLDQLRTKGEMAVEWIAAFRRKDREPISLSLNGVAVSVDGRPRYMTILARSLSSVPKLPAAETTGERTYRTLVERIPAVTYITEANGNSRTTYISPQVESMLGYGQNEWLTQPDIWSDVLHPDDRDIVLAEIERGRESGGFRLDHRMLTGDGRTLWVRNEAALVSSDDGDTQCWHGVICDISTIIELEVALGRSEARFRALVQKASGVVLVVEQDGTILYASPSIINWMGGSERIVGAQLSALDLLHQDDLSRFTQFLRDAGRMNGVSPDIEVRLRSAEGGWRHVDVVATNLSEDPDVQGIVLNARDVTERRDFEDLLSHQAFHDPLTDLANRSLFLDRLSHAVDRASRLEHVIGLLYLDIDNFKTINDNLGHETGDQLLVAVSKRLCNAVRSVDTVARLGGDEFTVLLEDLSGLNDAIQAAQRISKSLREPFPLPAKQVEISASIGIAHSDKRKLSPDDLMRAADMALYRAKNEGKARYAVFERGMTTPIHERLELEQDLRKAVDRDEIEIHFQPFVDLSNGFVKGVEALVRWQHPVRGLLMPEEFVGISESTGQIIELGQKVLEIGCRDVRHWQGGEGAAAPLSLSVNLSTYQFRHPTIVDDIGHVLRQSGLPPESLVLEITESLFMGDAGETVDILHDLKQLGVSLFIDDFGTGYSSLSFLKRFPLDGIKIDRSLIAGLERDMQNQRLVAAIIAAGQALDLGIVAEGIETIGQLSELRRLGCPDGQGHLFASPGPPSDIAPLVRSRVLLPQVRVIRDQPHRVANRAG